MILGSPAQTAGVEQGDQVLQIDNMQVDGQSPFQAASAISGGDGEPDTVPAPLVHLQVPMICFLHHLIHLCMQTVGVGSQIDFCKASTQQIRMHLCNQSCKGCDLKGALCLLHMLGQVCNAVF